MASEHVGPALALRVPDIVVGQWGGASRSGGADRRPQTGIATPSRRARRLPRAQCIVAVLAGACDDRDVASVGRRATPQAPAHASLRLRLPGSSPRSMAPRRPMLDSESGPPDDAPLPACGWIEGAFHQRGNRAHRRPSPHTHALSGLGAHNVPQNMAPAFALQGGTGRDRAGFSSGRRRACTDGQSRFGANARYERAPDGRVYAEIRGHVQRVL